MDFEFSEDTLMLRDMLRRFIQKEARPLEMDYFNLGELKPEQQTRLHRSIEQLGLWGLMAPEKYGGGGLDNVTACVIEEELGGTFIPLEIGNVPPLLYACCGDQIGDFLEPALAGSRRAIVAAREPDPYGVNPINWVTTAVQHGDHFILNGRKALSLVPDQDDFLIVFAKTPSDNPGQDQTAFLLDVNVPGMNVTKNKKVTLTLHDCQVGQESVLGQVGAGLRLAADEVPRAWIQMGARYLGIVERLKEMAAEHAKDWISHGAPLAVRPAIKRMLAEMSVEAETVRWLVYHAAWLADMQENDQIRIPAAQVRIASGEMLKHAIDRATMIYNCPGPTFQIEPQRLVQGVVPMEALDQALELARAVVANQIIGLSKI